VRSVVFRPRIKSGIVEEKLLQSLVDQVNLTKARRDEDEEDDLAYLLFESEDDLDF